ncbi:unnamed protein product [Effrenium voratum]|nr:unnamed protein product [Effrenium voratum]
MVACESQKLLLDTTECDRRRATPRPKLHVPPRVMKNPKAGPPVTLPPTQPPTQPPTAPRTVDETPDAPEASPVEVDGARSANVDFDELQRKLQQLACGTREDSKAKRTAVEDTPSPEKQIRFSESETAAEPEQHTTQQGRRFPALPHAAAVREPREERVRCLGLQTWEGIFVATEKSLDLVPGL